MPVLANARRERFAQLLAAGSTADHAYQEAGYKPDRSAAARLSAKVRKRVAELLSRAANRSEVTIGSIINELEEARELAASLEQTSAMVNAIMGKARVAGLLVDKTEQGKPGEFSKLTMEQKRVRANAIVHELGIEDSGKAIGPVAGTA